MNGIRVARAPQCQAPIDKMRPFLRDNRNLPIAVAKGQGMIILRSPTLRFLGSVVLILFLWIPRPLSAATAKAKPQSTTAQAKKSTADAAPTASTKPGTGQALKLGQFDDWIAYATPGAKKVCYALSVPKERLPKNLNRDPGYLFVSYRPDEKVRGEIAVVMGFAVKENAPAQALLGSSMFELAGKDTSLFVHNAAEEGTMLAAMKRGGSLLVKASSKRGNATTDRFSLAGIVQALDTAEKACK
jgi:hypothetical protein